MKILGLTDLMFFKRCVPPNDFSEKTFFGKVANISVFRMKDTPELNFKLCWFTFTNSLVIWFAVFEKKGEWGSRLASRCLNMVM